MRERRWYYAVKYVDGKSISRRSLSAATPGKLIDKALKLFVENWDHPPDLIKIEAKNTFSFQP
jgi:hypothetical protein